MSVNATLIVQILVFALFVVFTMKYVWPPIMQAMHERQKKIADGLAAAERGIKEQELAATKAKEILHQAKQQAAGIITEAKQQGNRLVDEARQTAQQESERIKHAAEAELTQSINQAKAELRDQVADIAVLGAQQILQREIDARAHQDLLGKLIAQL